MGWLVTRHALPADGAASIWSIPDHHASGRFEPVCPIARFSKTSDSTDLDSSLCCKRRLKAVVCQFRKPVLMGWDPAPLPETASSGPGW